MVLLNARAKATNDEILTSRLVDRVLRPLFPSDYHCEVYVQVMLLSADGVDQPDALAGLAASAALAASDIPIEHTTSEVRVARVNGEYVINPTFEQMKEADMDLMVGATKDNIMMVEGEMDEVSEQDLIGALKAAHEAIKPMCEMQERAFKRLAVQMLKRDTKMKSMTEELREELRKATYDACYAQAQSGDDDKKHREETYDKIKSDFTEAYDAAHTDLSEDDLEEKHTLIDRYFADVQRDSMRRSVLDTG